MQILENYYVYVHINKINDKKYVGKSKNDPHTRWGTHGQGYLVQRNGKYMQPLFAHAILKYGWDNFEHQILASGLNNDEACALEQKYIKEFSSNNPDLGYNLTDGGEGSPGRSLSETSRQKMSESQVKRFADPEQRKKLSDQRKGKPGHACSDETKKKISEANKGRKCPEAAKEKLSKALTGRKLSEETKQKMSIQQQTEGAHRLGKSHSAETKAKISKSRSGKNAGKDNVNSKSVKCVETGEIFESMAMAAKAIGQSSYTHISQCCHHERKNMRRISLGIYLIR